MFRDAYAFVRDLVADGGSILFVGTKKQAQDAIREEAERCGMFYVNNRWLGGMLTNFQTIKASIDRLRKLEETLERPEDGRRAHQEGDARHLGASATSSCVSLGGIKNMKQLPDAIFVIDPEEGRDRGQGSEQAWRSRSSPWSTRTAIPT